MKRLSEPATPEKLANLFIFDGVDPDIIQWIASYCSVYELDQDEVLLKRGQRNHALYVVLNGRLRIQLKKGEGPALSHIGEGRSVGEMSALEEEYTSASVIADCTSHVLRIENNVLWNLIDQSSIIARNLLRMLCTRVRYDNYTISETKKLQQKYEAKSNIDILTKLRNRRWLEESFDNYLAAHGPICLLMIDIDHFKDYNDKYGHLAGDQAIASVANVIRTSLNENDIAIRYGGEEYAMILSQTGLEYAKQATEQLLKKVQQQKIKDQQGCPLPSVTVSIGLAQYVTGENRDSLIARADTALYDAKRTGRNRYSLADTVQVHPAPGV